MKQEAQPALTVEDQQALDQYEYALKQEDLSFKAIRNYLSDLRQFMAWCEGAFREEQEDRCFTPQAVAPALLMHYRDCLQTILDLKPSTVNRALMSLKRYFTWTRKAQLIQANPASLIKFLPKEGSFPRHKALTGRALGHLTTTKYATEAKIVDVSPHDLLGYRMAEVVPLHRLAQIIGHESLDTTMLYVCGTKQDLQQDVEKITWI